MAAKKQESGKSKKRKQNTDGKAASDGSASKKPKLVSSNRDKERLKKPFKPLGKQLKQNKSKTLNENNAPLKKRERRLRAKELAEARKKKRKRHYTLEQELASLWEKMRQRNVAKEERSRFISEALQKMKGKIPEIATSHISSRVLQTCVKYCSQTEKDAVFDELKPHFLAFACDTYAVHLVKKMLDNASKKQLAEFISSLHGHVASLLRHMVGSAVIEHAYQLGNATQKKELLMELYSTELQLFKDLTSMRESRLLDVISKLDLQKGSVLRHMASVIQPILEKGIVDHSIIHRVLIEYLSIADKFSAVDIIQQLSGPLLVRMIHTREGSRIGVLCIKYGSAKERKKIVKGMKDHISKIARDQCGNLVLAYIVSTVDDTKLVTRIVIRELQTILKELVLDKVSSPPSEPVHQLKPQSCLLSASPFCVDILFLSSFFNIYKFQNGRHPLLQLLHPNCTRYFSPDDMASLSFSIPTLSTMGDLGADSEMKSSKDEESSEMEVHSSKEVKMTDNSEMDLENVHIVDGGKKDPSLRRQELLVDSGLAEKLVSICIENAEELLKSNFGKEVLFEVAMGGSGGILHSTLDDKLKNLHEAIAYLAAESKPKESEKEHVLENFHSSRTIRKLVLDSPSFATTLWTRALKGKCKLWAEGHSSKVICAYLETLNADIRKLAKKELQPLVDSGTLKIPENKQPANKRLGGE